jgi:hypothetical protein
MSAPKAQDKITLALLAYAERHGIHLGGFFLIGLGIYGGQYAKLFPDAVRDYAAVFCILVSACGLVFTVYHFILGLRARANPPAEMAASKRNRD